MKAKKKRLLYIAIPIILLTGIYILYHFNYIPHKKYTNKDFDILKKHLSATFKTPVAFSCDNNGKGKITFPFKNEDELERLITIFDALKLQENQ